ncbi:hypothetical protein HYH03_002034 [Edaphochlamys debaryana]|uniref:Uncharacterized protein n=1 Tax=Edaphochlamys debaryana TaxID=47281 RepID=A0A835YEZ1_9CHLO|nr:hypothetical protein HYH03_002034 [Edaphochlamys debaryana]|eukprot:KAG2500467.1 hypothetical protein HYH03_002034 [Edaphochlamys debaryana]
MRAPSLLFLVVLLVVYATQKAEAVDKVRCRNADFCSTGKLQHYVGPLDSAEQTKQAFELTAWKKELVVFAETRLEPAAHTLDRYRRAGYGHIIPVMPTLRDCTRLARVFEAHPSVLAAAANPPPGEEPYTSSRGNITCGFYRTEDASGNQYGSGFEYLAHNVGRTAWWRKWFTAARAVSLGYNVMSVDADTLPLGDWYGMVKAPPASDYAVISQAEYYDNINGGFTYIQNTAPGGPASYLLYELMQRAAQASTFFLSPGRRRRSGRAYAVRMALSAPYTCATAGGLSVIYALLQTRVGFYRLDTGCLFGTKQTDGKADDEKLTALSRAGGNFQEYVPTALMLLLLMETATPVSSKTLAAYGGALAAARVALAVAHSNTYNRNLPNLVLLRIGGFWTTIGLIVGAGAYVGFKGFKALQ